MATPRDVINDTPLQTYVKDLENAIKLNIIKEQTEDENLPYLRGERLNAEVQKQLSHYTANINDSYNSKVGLIALTNKLNSRHPLGGGHAALNREIDEYFDMTFGKDGLSPELQAQREAEKKKWKDAFRDRVDVHELQGAAGNFELHKNFIGAYKQAFFTEVSRMGRDGKAEWEKQLHAEGSLAYIYSHLEERKEGDGRVFIDTKKLVNYALRTPGADLRGALKNIILATDTSNLTIAEFGKKLLTEQVKTGKLESDLRYAEQNATTNQLRRRLQDVEERHEAEIDTKAAHLYRQADNKLSSIEKKVYEEYLELYKAQGMKGEKLEKTANDSRWKAIKSLFDDRNNTLDHLRDRLLNDPKETNAVQEAHSALMTRLDKGEEKIISQVRQETEKVNKVATDKANTENAEKTAKVAKDALDKANAEKAAKAAKDALDKANAEKAAKAAKDALDKANAEKAAKAAKDALDKANAEKAAAKPIESPKLRVSASIPVGRDEPSQDAAETLPIMPPETTPERNVLPERNKETTPAPKVKAKQPDATTETTEQENKHITDYRELGQKRDAALLKAADLLLEMQYGKDHGRSPQDLVDARVKALTTSPKADVNNIKKQVLDDILAETEKVIEQKDADRVKVKANAKVAPADMQRGAPEGYASAGESKGRNPDLPRKETNVRPSEPPKAGGQVVGHGSVLVGYEWHEADIIRKNGRLELHDKVTGQSYKGATVHIDNAELKILGTNQGITVQDGNAMLHEGVLYNLNARVIVQHACPPVYQSEHVTYPGGGRPGMSGRSFP